jgi:hypothetical protein
MATAFLHVNLLASAFVGDLGTLATAALPLSNALDSQPRVRARYAPATGISIFADFGANVSVGCVAFISTTLGLSGGTPTVRAQVSDDAGFGTAAWDTGTVAASTDAAAGGNVILVAPANVTARFMRVEIDDPEASFLDLGRIVAGPLWRPAYAPAYGMGEGRQILDRRDRNPHTGAEFPVAAVVNPRQASFTLPLISRAEAITEWRSMVATLGATGDALWIPDDSLSQAELNQRSLWGAMVQPGESALLTRSNFVGHTRAFTITERV